MQAWNVIITTQPVPEGENHVVRALRGHGNFGHSAFKDVCLGSVDDPFWLLERISFACAAGESWAGDLARVIPVEKTFRFTPDTLTERLKANTASFAERMTGGTFYVRLERRGMAGKINTPEVERAVADHLSELAERQGKHLQTSFANPDYIVAAETIGDECGIALLHRALREKYPFILPK